MKKQFTTFFRALERTDKKVILNFDFHSFEVSLTSFGALTHF